MTYIPTWHFCEVFVAHFYISFKILFPVRVYLKNIIWEQASESLPKLISSFDCILKCISHPFDNTLPFYDLGASAGLTPFKPDFIDHNEYSIPLCGISKNNKVIGIGTTIQTSALIIRANLLITQVTYHLPSSKLCLVRPQIFCQSCEWRSLFWDISWDSPNKLEPEITPANLLMLLSQTV